MVDFWDIIAGVSLRIAIDRVVIENTNYLCHGTGPHVSQTLVLERFSPSTAGSRALSRWGDLNFLSHLVRAPATTFCGLTPKEHGFAVSADAANAYRSMSAFGTKRTSISTLNMSAFSGKADIS